MNRVSGEILQSVVHPAHVPLHAEAQAPQIGGAGDTWPRGGFLGDSENAGEALEGDLIYLLQEIDCVHIFPAAKFIGNPFAGLPGIIQVNHGGDGVNAESIDVIFIKPKQSVGYQIIADFIAAVVIDERAPIELCSLAGVGVFVEVSAIKLSETVRVAREMSRSPVQDDSDAGIVTTIDKIHEIGGASIAARGGVIAERLVAPGAVKRMLHDR